MIFHLLLLYLIYFFLAFLVHFICISKDLQLPINQVHVRLMQVLLNICVNIHRFRTYIEHKLQNRISMFHLYLYPLEKIFFLYLLEEPLILCFYRSLPKTPRFNSYKLFEAIIMVLFNSYYNFGWLF